MNEIRLSPELYAEMIAYVTSHLPEEACGLVGGEGIHALRLYPVENMLHSPVAYEMEPLQQIRAMLAIENAGLELTAIIHSHPEGPARPSLTDVGQAYYPESAHIIISLADRERPVVRAFMIRDGVIDEIDVARVA